MRSLLLGIVPVLPSALLVVSCEGGAPVDLGLALRAPQGLLDKATAMNLYVFDAALAKCGAETGHVDQIPSATQTFPLSQTGCTGSATWCTTIKLDKDGTNKMFAVVATKAGATIAEGCTTKVIDQDPLQIEIQAHRFQPPACCGNGELEPGEQCDSGVAGSCSGEPPAECSGMQEDSVCYCDCTAKEILLSIDDAEAPNLENGPAGTKLNLALALGPGGVSNPTMLRAVFESTDDAAVGGADIHERFLKDDLRPITDPHPLSLQLRLPLRCSAVTGTGIVRAQRAPAIATASSDTVAIVYESDEDNGGEDYDIFLNAQIADGCAETKPCDQKSDCQTDCDLTKGTCLAAVKLNTHVGGASLPHVARGPAGTVLVTWTRKQGIFGRIWRTDGSTVPQDNEIAIAPNGFAARVAGSAGGFRVVYQGNGTGDPDGILMVPVYPDGTIGGAQLVNSFTTGVQDQPDIAMLDNGTALVTWHSGGDVFFQRFDTNGNAVPGDQEAPLNTSGSGTVVDQSHPAVTGANGFFLVAWETVGANGAGDIAARFVGGSGGFGYNSVTWQNDEFIVTDPVFTGGDRHRPAVALGQYAVVGWEDWATDHPGVYVRRFPPPVAE